MKPNRPEPAPTRTEHTAPICWCGICHDRSQPAPTAGNALLINLLVQLTELEKDIARMGSEPIELLRRRDTLYARLSESRVAASPQEAAPLLCGRRVLLNGPLREYTARPCGLPLHHEGKCDPWTVENRTIPAEPAPSPAREETLRVLQAALDWNEEYKFLNHLVGNPYWVAWANKLGMKGQYMPSPHTPKEMGHKADTGAQSVAAAPRPEKDMSK